MRLICPNCGAQYEVPDDVIPSAGRDVQCSSCGHTWFETPGASVEAEEGTGDAGPERSPATVRNMPPTMARPDLPTTPLPRGPATPERASVAAQPAAATQSADAELDDEDDEPQGLPASVAHRPRRQIDPEIAAILRAEAEREAGRRQSEAEPLESQPELGLDDAGEPETRNAEASRRMARIKGETDEPKSSARKDLFPDIEEINSTLRSTSERPAGTPGYVDATAPQRSGFRIGFLLVVGLAAIGAGAYAMAAQISAALPQAEPVLSTYVALVDDLRIALDIQVQRLLQMIGGPGA